MHHSPQTFRHLPRSRASTLIALISTIALLGLLGCQEPQVHTYQVPKTPEPPAADQTLTAEVPMQQAAVPVAPGAARWEAPQGWRPLPPQPMRKAGWHAGAAEGPATVTITAFPGDVGGDLANVNRWRRELGLAPLQQLSADTFKNVSLAEDGHSAKVVRLSGEAESTHAAIIPHDGQTWFIKMKGPHEAVKQAATAYTSLVQSLRFHP